MFWAEWWPMKLFYFLLSLMFLVMACLVIGAIVLNWLYYGSLDLVMFAGAVIPIAGLLYLAVAFLNVSLTGADRENRK